MRSKLYTLFLVGITCLFGSFLIFLIKLVNGAYGSQPDLSGAKLIYTGMFLVVILMVSFGFTVKE